MNSDIENWLEYLKQYGSRKRKHQDDFDIDVDDMCNELRLMAIYSLEDVIKEHHFTGRKLSSFLTNLENTLKQTKIAFSGNDIDKEFSLMIAAFTAMMIDLVNEIKLEIYSQGKNFNLERHFNFLKNDISAKTHSHKKRKTVSKIDLLLDIPSNNEDDGEDDDGDEYENDTEPETTDDNDDENIEDYDDESDSDDDDYEEEDEDDDDDDEDYDEAEEDEIDYYEIKNTGNDRKINKQFMAELTKTENTGNQKDEIMHYFCSLDNDYKKILIDNFKKVNNCLDSDIPVLFRILNMPVPDTTKKSLLNKLIRINTSYGEVGKLKTWLDNVMKIPFGIYKGININSIKPKKVKKFLKSLKKEMDNAVWGHDEAKRQIIQTMGQRIRNPNCKGNVLGIWGPPGNGKTSLIKDGIAKAMNKPFVFISLGGATDASVLEGHSYTYEGSIYGRIAQGIINSKCMDPIVYFDELDKVSTTPKGREIVNLLIHLIDPVQNAHFRDKYFYDIDIDMSKVTFIFSFNEPRKVNYILMDRITAVETKHLMMVQKLHIGTNYLLPNILEDIGLDRDSIVVPKDIMTELINNYTNEGGVRRLKKLLYEICRELNINNLTKVPICNNKVTFPFTVTKQIYDKIMMQHNKYTHDMIHVDDSVGIVNGLWANSLGLGGILPIQSMLIPSKGFMEIKATGSLEKVIKESIDVALSVAWNYIDNQLQKEWLSIWKDNPQCFHIHCPDGAVPKDGPSAGGALTLVMYSRLTNKKISHNVAMTGEINLQGNITKIGGLEEKLNGAKRAGVVLALIPKENEDDLEKIKQRDSKLIDSTFKVISIENFGDVLDYALV